jgi:hypothetical protein
MVLLASNRPWAFLWANESWKSKFKAVKYDVTYMQRYDDPVGHAEYLVRAFSSPLYTFIDGRPILGVYLLFLAPRHYLHALRSNVYRLSGWSLFIVQVSGANRFAREGSVDAVMEFYPNQFWTPDIFEDGMCGVAYDHEPPVIRVQTPFLHKHGLIDVPVWRGGLVHWDATPRYPDRPHDRTTLAEDCDSSAAVFGNGTQARMLNTLCESSGSRTIFSLFAFNEWGEGRC